MNLDDEVTGEVHAVDRTGPPLSDLVVGAAAIVGGVAAIFYGLSMPTIGEGAPGPGLLPGMIGGLAALFGALLIVFAVVKARRGAAAPSEGAADASVVDPELESGRSPWINALVVLGSILFYVLASRMLGFLITMFLILLVLMLTLGSKRLPALITAVCLTAGLYALFELVLLVQLPDGLLV